MNKAIITSSACLISLEKIGGLDILSALFEPVIITPAIQKEFSLSVPWMQIQVPTDTGMMTTLKMLVSESESETIALAYELNCPVILDDRQSRLVAKNLGVYVIGTMGILIKAKKAGLIFSLHPILSELEMSGFYIESSLKTATIALVGE